MKVARGEARIDARGEGEGAAARDDLRHNVIAQIGPTRGQQSGDLVALQRRLSAMTAQLSDVEKKLSRREEEHDEDAETIGKLLAEIAEREQRLRGADALARDRLYEAESRISHVEAELNALDTTYADTVIELETAQDRLRATQEEATRLRQELERERAGRAEVDHALTIAARKITALETDLAAAKGRTVTVRPPRLALAPDREDARSFARGELGWLLEVVHASIDQVRTATEATAKRLDDARIVFDAMRAADGGRGASDAYASFVAALRHVDGVQAALTRADHATSRAADIVATMTSGGDHENRDEQAVTSSREIVRHLWALRDALAPLVSRSEGDSQGDEPARRPPPPPLPRPSRRMQRTR